MIASLSLREPHARGSHAEAILRAAIHAADPRPLVQQAVAVAPELHGASVRIIAIGKAAAAMAEAAARGLHGRFVGGTLVVPAGTLQHARAPRFEIRFGAHPLPDENSAWAGAAVESALQSLGAHDVALVLLSGGASSLAALPREGISIREYAACTDLLFRAGADIRQVNTVRKHIDRLKGGRMAVAAAPARVVAFVLSDVVGDDLDVIASGPLTADPTTREDAVQVLRSCGVWRACAESIHTTLLHGAENPKPGAAVFQRARISVIGSNELARRGAARAAAALGYRPVLLPSAVTGEAREAGARLAREALRLRAILSPGTAPVCLIAGGETTVHVRGAGRGGRNQELVLAASLALKGEPGITVGSIGTDGIDGPTNAAGAVAQSETIEEASRRDVDPHAALEGNDSYGFFNEVGGLIRTGPTGTNVLDVQVVLIEPGE